MKRKLSEVAAVVDARMHVNNMYRYRKPAFEQLPNVSKLLSAKGKLDFDDPVALRTLTKDLLLQDFGVKLEMPENHLIPTVTSRLNYLLWVHDLLHPDCPPGHFVEETNQYVFEKEEPDITGIDIGVGASAIYPLLGHRVFKWKFLGTDIDPASIEAATANIKTNSFEHSIRVKLNGDPSKILVGVLPPDEFFSFCMCNPPFYEREDHASEKLTATKHEKATFGGELAFIERLIEDSLALKERVLWFTSLIGKKVHLKQIKRKLVESNVLQVRTTEIAQGRMSRWAVAWSFSVAPRELTATKLRRRLNVRDPQAEISRIRSMMHELGFEVQAGVGLSVEALLTDHASASKDALLHFRVELQCLTPGHYLLSPTFLAGDREMYSATEQLLVSKIQELY